LWLAIYFKMRRFLCFARAGMVVAKPFKRKARALISAVAKEARRQATAPRETDGATGKIEDYPP